MSCLTFDPRWSAITHSPGRDAALLKEIAGQASTSSGAQTLYRHGAMESLVAAALHIQGLSFRGALQDQASSGHILELVLNCLTAASTHGIEDVQQFLETHKHAGAVLDVTKQRTVG